jgi:hypothetical protein
MGTPDPAILPGLAAVIGVAKDRLIAVRPSAQPFVESGTYATVFRGWRGQYSVCRARVGSEVQAARLSMATGDALTELAASNFDTPRQVGATNAVGEATMARSIVHYAVTPDDPTITLADATNESAFVGLYYTIVGSTELHVNSVFDPNSGVGAHLAFATGYYTPLPDSTMGGYCASANALMAWALSHFADVAAHLDADALDVYSTPAATATNPSGSYSAAPRRDQVGLLAVVNATKAALNAHYALRSAAGTIRQGTVIQLSSAPAAIPPVAGGQYLVATDTYAPVAAASLMIPVTAVRPGPAASIPAWASGGPTLTATPRSSLFDAASLLPLTVASLSAAGGSSGQADEVLVAAAVASWTGRYGPTVGALTAGTLQALGVERVTIREDPTTGIAWVYPTDAAWAQSLGWNAQILQALRNGWQGLGCQVVAGAVVNQLVRVELVVTVRDARYLADTSDLLTALQAAVLNYFDTRPDFWIWRMSALRAVASAVDRVRVKSCTSVIVRDGTGIQLNEPVDLGPTGPLTHYWFADNALSVSFVGP